MRRRVDHFGSRSMSVIHGVQGGVMARDRRLFPLDVHCGFRSGCAVPDRSRSTRPKRQGDGEKENKQKPRTIRHERSLAALVLRDYRAGQAQRQEMVLIRCAACAGCMHVHAPALCRLPRGARHPSPLENLWTTNWRTENRAPWGRQINCHVTVPADFVEYFPDASRIGRRVGA